MFRIFGPPGTGKTTTLLNMVEKQMEDGILPSQIAFLAFTRKAAKEARERASKRFKLNMDKDLFYFKTLHSFAFAMSDIQSTQLMKNDHMDELSTIIKFNLRGSQNGSFGDTPTVSENPIMRIIQLSRLLREPLENTYRRVSFSADFTPFIEVDYIAKCYRKYKKQRYLFDYTDILERFVEKEGSFCPNFKVCYIDEAQDLSPLQWEMIEFINKRSDKMYLAGDDDQAIYRWAGASVESFISMQGVSDHLLRSYRVPKSVHRVADRIVRRIKNRRSKLYTPKEGSAGLVKRVSAPSSVDMSEGEWLVLAQCNYMLISIADMLRSQGLLFELHGKRSISDKITTAVRAWETLRNGKQIDLQSVKTMYTYMRANTRVKRGFKKITATTENPLYSIEDLQQNHGLLANVGMIWHVALDGLPETESAYLTAMLRRKEKITSEPRIKVSTIHGAKGGEADNILLLTDISPTADNSRLAGDEHAQQLDDDLHRLFYVAVTRTKENLYLVDPDDQLRSYSI